MYIVFGSNFGANAQAERSEYLLLLIALDGVCIALIHIHPGTSLLTTESGIRRIGLRHSRL